MGSLTSTFPKSLKIMRGGWSRRLFHQYRVRLHRRRVVRGGKATLVARVMISSDAMVSAFGAGAMAAAIGLSERS
jgi:hypothetical protein